MGYDQVQQNRQVIRLQLAQPLTNRSYAFSKDGYLQNCFIEKSATGKVFVRKRPGYSYTTSGGTAYGTGQGIYYYGDRFYAVQDNTLYRCGGLQYSYSNANSWTNRTTTANSFGPLSGATSAVFKGKLWLFGGVTGLGTYSGSVWSSGDGATWAQVIPLAPWGGRTGISVVVFQEQIFVMGGGDAGAAFNDVWVSDNGIDWQILTETAPWSVRRGAGLVVFNNSIMLMGGHDPAGPTYNNEVWSSVDGITWKQLPSAGWASRAYFGAYSINGRIYIVGGTDAAGPYNDCYYTNDGLSWTSATAAVFASARSMFGYCIYDDKMWAIGGKNNVGTYLNNVYYSSDGITWNNVPLIGSFTARVSCTAASFICSPTVNSLQPLSIWVLGGVDSGSGVLDTALHADINAQGSTSFALTTSASTLEPMQFATVSPTSYLVFKNNYDAWTLWGNTVSKISDKNFPKKTVPGIVYLDRRIFVMDPNGIIYGSDINDPTSFQSFNYIEAEYEPDAGIALGKYLNYIVAFGSRTMQFFYDAGTYPGSPLAVQMNMTQKVGCVNGYTLVSMDGTLVWVGGSEEAGRGIFYFENGRPIKISTPEIDRLLDQETFILPPFACGFGITGHRLYLLTLRSLNLTLVFDFVEKQWHRWSKANGDVMPFKGYATNGEYSVVQEEVGANLYKLNESYYSDYGTAIVCSGVTDPVDFDSYIAKFQRNVTIVGDRNGGNNTITVQWSDDDYGSWSTGVSIELNQTKPWTWRGGRFSRRAYKWTCSNSTLPMRLEALEVQVDFGNV